MGRRGSELFSLNTALIHAPREKVVGALKSFDMKPRDGSLLRLKMMSPDQQMRR